MKKPSFCKNCPINHVTEGYVPLDLADSTTLAVGEASGEEEAKRGKPFVGGAGGWLNSMCKAARVSRNHLNIINTIGCKPPGNVYPTSPLWSAAVRTYYTRQLVEYRKKYGEASPEYQEALRLLPARTSTNEQGRAGVAYCEQHHLRPVLEDPRWSRIMCLGDQALSRVTGRHGISLWRGSPLQCRYAPQRPPYVMSTLHPAYLARDASMFSVAVGDLRKTTNLPPENYKLYATLEDLRAWRSRSFAFDFEWDEFGSITLCGLSDRFFSALVVDFVGEMRHELQRIFEEAEELIGHNIVGADTKYFERLGWKTHARLIDTMLVQHLVQPDMRHGLAFVASVFTNKVFWKGRGEEREDADGVFLPTGAQWKTWNSPEAIPREYGGYGGCLSGEEAYRLYNARDTDGTFQCAPPLLHLLKRFEMENTYWNVSVPVAYVCRDMGDAGLRVDPSRSKIIREELDRRIAELEVTLPYGLAPYEVMVSCSVPAPPHTYRPRTKTCKGSKKLGTQHPSATLEYTIPQPQACGVCGALVASPKMQPLKKLKGEKIKRVAPWHSSPKIIEYAKSKGCKVVTHAKTGSETSDKKARKVWGREHTEFALLDTLKALITQRNNFLKDKLLTVERVFPDYLVHGTAEGRLSSVGRRRGIDPNIQNQPLAIRKIYVPDKPGWGILAADLVQGENMLTAWLAKDWERWERLHTPGFDEHSYMASEFFKVPYAECCKGGAQEHLRHAGKVVNHGRNYGLGAKKTQEYLELQGFYYAERDIKEMIEIWRSVNKRTAAWQQETIAMAQRQGFLVNPFGRRRWFQSRDFATKALAFLPASTLADAVLRMMIGLHVDRFPEECRALGLAATGMYPHDWALRIQVHDELTSMGPDATHLDTARLVHNVMTQPWRELDGFAFQVELSYSTDSWGACKSNILRLPE